MRPMESTPIKNDSPGENESDSGNKRRFSQLDPEIPEPDFVASGEADVEPLESEPTPASNMADEDSEAAEEDDDDENDDNDDNDDDESDEEGVEEEIVIDGDDPAIINDVVEVVRDYGARSEDEEETEDDRAFISDDAIVLETNHRRCDVDPSLILPEGTRRNRKPVDKWVHPDEAEVCIDHGYAVESDEDLDDDDEDNDDNDSDPDFENDEEELTDEDEEEATDDEETDDEETDEEDLVEITKYTIKAMTEHDCEAADSTEGVMVHWEFEHEKYAAHWQDPTAPLHVGEFTIVPSKV